MCLRRTAKTLAILFFLLVASFLAAPAARAQQCGFGLAVGNLVGTTWFGLPESDLSSRVYVINASPSIDQATVGLAWNAAVTHDDCTLNPLGSCTDYPGGTRPVLGGYTLYAKTGPCNA